MSRNNRTIEFSNAEWTKIAAVGAVGGALGGPLGAAGAVAGVVVGTYVARRLGWQSHDGVQGDAV